MPPVHSTLEEVTRFLERYPPFSSLTKEALHLLAASAEIEYFPAGTELLARDGRPSEHLFVVRRGAVELEDDEGLVDVLDEGESFGHPSLLSGLPPPFTVRAREDTLCFLFPSEPTVAALSDPAGIRYVATTLRERLERSAVRRRATPWASGRVGSHMRPPITCPPATSVREAAVRMTDADATCVVVPLDRGGYGIVTDGDLRARVVTGEVHPDAPISELVRFEALTAAAERPVLEALADMLNADAEQAVVVDEDGRLVGMLDHSTLLTLESASPVVLRHEIERSRTVEDVQRATADIPRLAVRLLDASAAPLDVLAMLSSVTDATTRRLTELAVEELGEPPAPWAWLALGSEARREQTLATDQDNALAYDGEDDGVHEYFAAFAERVNTWLATCGYQECRAGVMARNGGWRLTRGRWLELYERWLRLPSRRDVHMAMIGLDLRGVAGPLEIEAELDLLLATAPAHPYFLERIGQAALETRPPLGFLRDLVVERSGEHLGTFDIKAGGTSPIVTLARCAALAVGATPTSTVDRLRAAAARGGLPRETALELEEAFVTICGVRLEHQAAQVERGVEPDNQVDPHDLAPLARRQLKEAFRAVARAQRSVEAHVATRIP